MYIPIATIESAVTAMIDSVATAPLRFQLECCPVFNIFTEEYSDGVILVSSLVLNPVAAIGSFANVPSARG